MAALLVSLAVMSVLMSALLPVWRFQARREKEAELVFRGEQYARAVGLFARKNGGAFPPNIDVLVQGRYLRKKYKDPMTKDGEFQPLFVGANMPGQPQAGGTAARAGGRGTAAVSGGTRIEVTPSGETAGPVSGGAGSFTTQGGSPPQGSFGPTTGGSAGIMGVVSKSKETSIMLYRGGTRYSEWVFRYAGLQNQPGAVPGQGAPGMPRTGPDGRPIPAVPGLTPGGRGRGRGRGPGVSPGGLGPGGREGGRAVRPPG